MDVTRFLNAKNNVLDIHYNVANALCVRFAGLAAVYLHSFPVFLNPKLFGIFVETLNPRPLPANPTPDGKTRVTFIFY